MKTHIIKAIHHLHKCNTDAAAEALLESLKQTDIEPMLRLPDVLKLVPMDKVTLRAAVKAGCFPAPVRISKRLLAWRSADIRGFCNGTKP